jgi:hypothetical protein
MSRSLPRIDPHGTGVKKNIQRFPPTKVVGTGIDPLGSFKEFLKKDVKVNIDLHRDTVKRIDDLETRKPLPAIGTTTMTKGFPVPRSGSTGMRVASETDHISFYQPDQDLRYTSAREAMKQPVTRFGKSQETKEGWAPRTYSNAFSNCQSVGYNPITFEANPHIVTRKTTNIDARRMKGITEFSDKQHGFSENTNPAHGEALREDPRGFYRRTGIFSHMYDASARYGYMTMPFERHQDFGGKPAFKC